MNSSEPEVYYRRSVFIPFLDSVISELKEHLVNHNHILSNIQVVIPSRIEKNTLVSDIQFYETILPNPSSVFSEYELWKSKWINVPKSERGKTATSGLAQWNRTFYLNIWKILQILATLPVSTASAERSFSSLRRLKNNLRNAMGEDQFTCLALLSIHRDISVYPVHDEICLFCKRKRYGKYFIKLLVVIIIIIIIISQGLNHIGLFRSHA